MWIFDEKFREIFSFQIVSIILGLAAGTILSIYTDRLLILPGIFILLPGFLEMRGNISGSFASRLSSGLFLKVINPKRKRTRIVRGNLLASFILAASVCLILGILAFLFTYTVFGVFAPVLILIPVIAGLISNAIEVPLTLYMTCYLFRRGHDPNNIMGPFITSTGDIISIISLLIAMVII